MPSLLSLSTLGRILSGVKSINMASAIREHLNNSLAGPSSPQQRGGSFLGNSHTRTSISTPHTDLYHSRDRSVT